MSTFRRAGRGRAASVHLAVLLLVALHLAGPGPVAAAPRAAPFRLRTLTGETIELARLLKQGPVLLDFWATWCKPCVASLPEIEALSREFGPRGLTVVGVSIDGPRNESRVRPFITRLKLTYPIGLDEDGALQQGYRVKAVPTSILIDRDGTIVQVRQGYLPGEGVRWRATLEALLPAPAGADSAAVDSTRS